MGHRRQPKHLLKDVVGRRLVDGAIYRELACGHLQKQPRGGAAKCATQGYCRVCVPWKTAFAFHKD